MNPEALTAAAIVVLLAIAALLAVLLIWIDYRRGRAAAALDRRLRELADRWPMEQKGDRP